MSLKKGSAVPSFLNEVLYQEKTVFIESCNLSTFFEDKNGFIVHYLPGENSFSASLDIPVFLKVHLQ